jgi:cyclophilin family peptidyl-prolyl cis-trans isomerase
MQFFRARILWLLGLVLMLTAQAGTLVQFRTPLGDIELELFDRDKPITVENFLRYARGGVWTNMIVHRWVPGFVIQGGGIFITNRATAQPAFAAVPTFGIIKNEYSAGRTLSNTYGTIAMARSQAVDSATSQWFINLGDNSSLDNDNGGFTVFGRVVGGTNVLNRFNKTTIENGVFRVNLGAPLNELPILSATATYEDLVYVDVSLLNVRVTRNGPATRITWNSIKDRPNLVEFTTAFPPNWQRLAHVTGTGNSMSIDDPVSDPARFYRVQVEY